MLTLELEVAVPAVMQLANLRPKAEQYSTFEALESFSSFGDEFCGFLP